MSQQHPNDCLAPNMDYLPDANPSPLEAGCFFFVAGPPPNARRASLRAPKDRKQKCAVVDTRAHEERERPFPLVQVRLPQEISRALRIKMPLRRSGDQLEDRNMVGYSERDYSGVADRYRGHVALVTRRVRGRGRGLPLPRRSLGF
jgi:hypothetical protein